MDMWEVDIAECAELRQKKKAEKLSEASAGAERTTAQALPEKGPTKI